MGDWREIDRMLQDRAMEVVQHLLPSGKLNGQEWEVGDLGGKQGKSLKVCVAGPKLGVWTDFAGEKGGKTLMALWTKIQGGDFKKAINEARAWLGYDDSVERRRFTHAKGAPSSHETQAQVTPPNPDAVRLEWEAAVPVVEGSPVWSYLTGERHLTPSAIRAYGVREVTKKNRAIIVWPYWATSQGDDEAQRIIVADQVKDELPAWLKFEALDRVDGKKREWTTKAPEKSLFGTNVPRPEGAPPWRHLLICEGEKDALTWYGIPALRERGVLPVSVPFGAKWRGQDKHRPSPNRQWLDRDWDWITGFETVIVAMDADEPGDKAAEDIINEIGPGLCRYVKLPVKDANAAAQGAQPGWSQGLIAAIDNGREFAPDRIRRAKDYREQLHGLWFGGDETKGLKLPLEVPFRLRTGECTVWTGDTGSGKTTCLQFCMVGMMAQGERVMVASMETQGKRTMDKLVRQVWGRKVYNPKTEERYRDKGATDAEIEEYRKICIADGDEVLDWLDGRLWLYDHVGIVHWKQLMESFRWARRRLGITQFIVDNFMRIGIVKDDYAQQAQAANEFAGLGMELDAHIHLVVHKKKSDNRRASNTRDIGGAQEVGGNAYNVVEIERDDRKGHEMSLLFQERENLAQPEFEAKLRELNLKPDGKFILHKQREGDVQNFSKYLHFMWEGQQYCDYPPGHEKHHPVNFIRDTSEATTGEEYREEL